METTHTWWRTLAFGTAWLAAMSLLAALPAGPASAAPATACRVKHVESGRTFASLQKAVRAAGKRHHLVVRGTCHGRTEILKDLTIRGRRSRRSGVPTLDADRKGTVVTIGRYITVKVVGLTIRDGRTTGAGGGVVNRGKLTLRSVVVRNNKAINGGGIWSDPHSRLVLDGKTVIKRNVADVGGGVRVAGSLVVRGGARIAANKAINGAGVAVEPGFDATTGRVSLDGQARISRNTASYMGGGVFVSSSSLLTLAGDARISGNKAERGGGVYNAGGPVEDAGRVTLDASSRITGNAATYGGGVYNSSRCQLTMLGSSAITGNTTTGKGGGVFSGGDLTMGGTSVIGWNAAAGVGGGLYVPDDSESDLTGVSCGPGGGANVHDNSPDDCHIDSV